MYKLAYSYTLSEFLDQYVLQHLIMYPICIIALTIVIVLTVRFKGLFFVTLVVNKDKKYYTRINYKVLTGIIFGAIGSICILLLVGIVYNTTMSNDMHNTIDDIFGIINTTQNNLDGINDSLTELQQKLSSGLNGSTEVAASQQQIITQLENVIIELDEMSYYLSNFSSSVVSDAANTSHYARDILISLQDYPQLQNIPDPNEIPIIDANEISGEFNDSQDSILGVQDQLRDFETQVAGITSKYYDFSDAISDIDSAKEEVSDANASVATYYKNKDSIEDNVNDYDRIRIAIIVLTYVFPLVVAVAGLLAVQLRTSEVMRGWYHTLLVGASLCGIFAGLYFTVSIIVDDACQSPSTSLFVAVRSAFPDYETQQWYHDLVDYFPLISDCNASVSLIDYFDLPPEIMAILDDPNSLIANVSTNYTGLIVNATNQLDSGIESINSINFTSLLNATSTKSKLVSIQSQLQDLSNFGFSMANYNSALADVNTKTSKIPATYPNGTFVELALYYVAQNISLLQLDKTPYVYTPQDYRDDVNTSLQNFLALDEAYHSTLNLTTGINKNVTLLITMIDELETSATEMRELRDTTHQMADQIYTRINDINDIVNNLMTVVIPNYFGLTKTYDVIMAAVRCDYITAVYKSAVSFVCDSTMDASAAFVATHCLAGCVLLVANVAAHYAWIAFRHPYKPVFQSPFFTLRIDDETFSNPAFPLNFPAPSASRRKFTSAKLFTWK